MNEEKFSPPLGLNLRSPDLKARLLKVSNADPNIGKSRPMNCNTKITNLFSRLCVFLIFKAMYAPEKIPADPQVAQAREKPLAYQFYRGVELHPRLLGVGKFLIAVAVHNATFEFKFHPASTHPSIHT